MAKALKLDVAEDAVKPDMSVRLAAALERAREVGFKPNFLSRISKQEWLAMNERKANVLAFDPD